MINYEKVMWSRSQRIIATIELCCLLHPDIDPETVTRYFTDSMEEVLKKVRLQFSEDALRPTYVAVKVDDDVSDIDRASNHSPRSA